MLAVVCVITAAVMALLYAFAWVLFFHMWIFWVIGTIAFAYWLGLEHEAND